MENGWEPIEWIVLTIEDGSALLVSKYGLDTKPFLENSNNYTWEKCELRAWLNGAFYEYGFNSAEKELIAEVTLQNLTNSADQSLFGENARHERTTNDRIFLLSEEEVMKYLPQETLHCKATAYAEPYTTTYMGNKLYWLRTKGAIPSNAMTIGADFMGMRKSDIGILVRPAMWIRLDPDLSSKE